MTGLAAFGLWLLAWAPNDHLLWTKIEAADALEHRLVPWREILEPASPLWIVWHGAPTFGPALFVSEEDWHAAQGLWLTEAERLLPQYALPRLVLSEQHFRADSGAFKRLANLQADSAERLLHALISAHLDRLSRQGGTFQGELEDRAAALMGEVEPAFRVEAYRTALAEFAAHLLSISHEIGRHQRRRAAKGESLCAAIGHPASLFGFWRRAIEQGEYRGYKPAARGPEKANGASTDAGTRSAADPSASRSLGDLAGLLGQPGRRWVQTRAKLGREDKDWILSRLGGEWHGDPSRDFAFLCP